MITLLLALTILLELAMFSKPAWRRRTLFVFGLTVFVPALTSAFALQHPFWLSAVIVLLSVGRLSNLFRIAKARMHEEYLRRATARTASVIGFAQLLVLAGTTTLAPLELKFTAVAASIALVQLIAAALIVFVTGRNIYKTRYRQGTTFYSDKEMPTVSVLIPARNETVDLEECLRSVLASDYPKLEIIVLDDCSQLKTSDIIKSFAHDGVRFVKGHEPSDNWLAKNQAYQKLYDEASGELLLFCGVDVRFGPHAISALVTELKNRNKQMISILPHRLSGSLAGAFIQPMRYWWELSLPRRLVNRPPVLSTCWLITSKTMRKMGGFAAVSHSIAPEAYFAREIVRSDGYGFIRSNDTLDIQTRKSFSKQRATAIRTRYPQLRRRPENVLGLVGVELFLLLGPFVGLIHGVIAGSSELYISVVACVLLVINHITIMQLTSPANVAVALVNFPLEVITDVAVLVTSMLRYEFGTVEWKDRNVCIPVMHVIPKLPRPQE